MSLQKALERDLLADRPAKKKEATCFTCGRGYLPKPKEDESNRFCSTRCREGFDAGAPYDPAGKTNRYSLPIGPTGFLINCLGCGKRFDSRGLRCCSIECERRYRERAENIAAMAEVDMDKPAKRKCEHCDGDIPNWRNGRKVSTAARFCSQKCQISAWKGLRALPAV
jgi:hypothetical protein